MASDQYGDSFGDRYGYDPAAHPEQQDRNKSFIQHDASGKAFVIDPWGQTRFLTSVEEAKLKGSSGLFSNKEFNPETGEYETRINWGNIIGVSTAGVIGANGIAGLLGAGGGAVAPTVGPEVSYGVDASIPTTLGIDSATSLGLPVTEGLGTAGGAGGAGAVAAGADAAAAAAAKNGTPGSEGYAPGNPGNPADPGYGSGFLKNVLNNSSTNGMPDWLKTALGVAGPVLAGLGEGLLTQHRNSFSGTSSDPVKLQGENGPMLDAFRNKLTDQMANPPQFSADATPQQPPVFNGPGLPGPIGLSGQASGVRRKAVTSPQDTAGGDDATRATKALSILGYG